MNRTPGHARHGPFEELLVEVMDLYRMEECATQTPVGPRRTFAVPSMSMLLRRVRSAPGVRVRPASSYAAQRQLLVRQRRVDLPQDA